MKQTKKQAAIGFIFITMLIDVTGWGIIIPVIPKLIKELINGDISEAAKYGGWLTFAYAITQFLFAPFIGNLSDKFGRRPVILISLFAFALDYLLLAFSPTIVWLFIGRIIVHRCRRFVCRFRCLRFFRAEVSFPNQFLFDLAELIECVAFVDVFQLPFQIGDLVCKSFDLPFGIRFAEFAFAVELEKLFRVILCA